MPRVTQRIPVLGAWDSSKAVNTVYQALTDGFVMAYNGGQPTTFTVYTDSSNPPTTIRGTEGGLNSGDSGTITMPVRKGDYWKVTTNNSTPTIFWIPFS